jgi:type I restriction enzyme S subunit
MKGKDFQRHCRPTETTVPHISPIEVREFLFPLPSDDQRERFEAEISVVAKLTEQAHQHLSNEDRLFTSLQHRAFNGEL